MHDTQKTRWWPVLECGQPNWLGLLGALYFIVLSSTFLLQLRKFDETWPRNLNLTPSEPELLEYATILLASSLIVSCLLVVLACTIY